MTEEEGRQLELELLKMAAITRNVADELRILGARMSAAAAELRKILDKE